MMSQLLFKKQRAPSAIVFDSTGSVPLTEGGEGYIYLEQGQVLKIYKPKVNLLSKRKKIQLLMDRAREGVLPPEAVCPRQIVVDRAGAFIGFSMEQAEGEEMRQLANRKFVMANNITTREILSMLVKVQTVMERLHRNRIFIGDLNDRNILFDRQFRIYFIDCDSWAVEDEKCEVAMDLFRDPLLCTNAFGAETDTYAFAVLAWKLLTRIHPFGGTMEPDINLLERMKNGISVIDNPNVRIPKTAKSWRNLSPALIRALQRIFQNQSRELAGELTDMLDTLKFCDVDREYYYGKYTSCPLCDQNALLRMAPQCRGRKDGLWITALLPADDVKMVFDENLYLDQKGCVVNVRLGKTVKAQYGVRCYFTSEGCSIEDFAEAFVVHSGKDYRIEKKYKSRIVVEGSQVYYISKQNTLTNMTVLKMGNSIQPVCKCSSTAYFEVKGGKYCLLNVYAGKLVITANEGNTEIKYDTDVINYGIHFDAAMSQWLLLLEDSAGKHRTYIVKDREAVFETDQIKYGGPLSAPCISSGTIYYPMDGKIRGFSHAKSAYKDFACAIINESSVLEKRKNQFVVVNDENVYLLNAK
ncbi:MAG: hypothetical protein K2O40_09760 [Lachnospiraceae bacterium]|nr:hypothetical protein [Lachnospiraceae bacterium]